MAEQERLDGACAAQPTLVDVALAAGVSRQTVSNVLHAPDRVRPETRERVAQFIAKLGYQPNRVAQDLRANASRMIGCRIKPLAPDALASIHDRFLHALAEAGRAADHHVLLFTAADSQAEVECAARLRRGGGAAGFVVYDVIADDERPRALLDLGVPFVAFGRTAQGTDEYAWVDVDNPRGTAAAVDHLVHRGHRRIGYLGWPDDNTIGARRALGWRTAVERHGLAAECLPLGVRGADSVAEGARMADALLARAEPPTAVVTATDTLAVGVLRAAQQCGLEVGRDLAIVGFDDTPTAAALDLSSVRQPIEGVGKHVMTTLLAATGTAPAATATATAARTATATPAPATGGPPPLPAGRLLEPDLIIRASSASPAPEL